MESLDAGLSGSPEKINKRRIHQTNDVITYRLIPEERAYIYLAHGEITENSMSRVPCLQKHAPPSSRASPKFSRIHNAIGHQAMQHIWLEYCQLMTGAFCCVQWLGPRIQRYISWIRNRWPVCTVSDAGANPVVVWDAMHITCTSSESSETHNSIIYIHIYMQWHALCHHRYTNFSMRDITLETPAWGKRSIQWNKTMRSETKPLSASPAQIVFGSGSNLRPQHGQNKGQPMWKCCQLTSAGAKCSGARWFTSFFSEKYGGGNIWFEFRFNSLGQQPRD